MRRREPDSIADAAREDAARREDEARNDAEYLAALNDGTASEQMAELAEWICAEMPDPDRLMDLPPRRSKFRPVGTAEVRGG